MDVVAAHEEHFDSSSEAAGGLAEVSGVGATYKSTSVASGVAGDSDQFEVVPHRANVQRVANEDPFPATSKPVSLAADMLLHPGAQGQHQLRQLDVMSSAKAGAVLQVARQFEANVATDSQAVQALTLLACVLCIALRGAVTLEARWECIQMLFVVSCSACRNSVGCRTGAPDMLNLSCIFLSKVLMQDYRHPSMMMSSVEIQRGWLLVTSH